MHGLLQPCWPFRGFRRSAFGTIVVDPPWLFKSNSAAKPGRNARRHYDCMTLAEIAAFPVGELAADDCWLFLWITGPFLAIGAQVAILKAWGFRPRAIGFAWFKTNADGSFWMGPGHNTRGNPEFVVIGKRGRPKRASRGVRSQIVDRRREHSRKPDEFYARVEELVGDGHRRADIFSRQRRPGWWCWGREVDKF